ncbi:GTPase Era [Caldanaerobius polysaccharolyticus]|uniref:GTPase Era n=1 Tax=Caldanaerobius polysaccharolyticus TaxID=44256 RepID=UPI00047B9293|nr:GTPase Era [Caldanaerobius polysaccharolyticus]
MYRSGFVTIIGRTNVGKSTLMNALLGEKISIISHKPQTTRNEIKGILSGEDYQIVFLDTPGLHKPKNKLGEFMIKTALNTLEEVDCVLFMVEADSEVGSGDKYIAGLLKDVKTPIVLVLNKIDMVDQEVLKQRVEEYSRLGNFTAVVCISAHNGVNLQELIDVVKKVLPEGPRYFPEDMITDQPERNIVSELIREKMLLLLKEEVPHGIAVDVESITYVEQKDLVEIRATVYCEKESHKMIIIGKNGSMIKKIGTMAREDIERLLGSKVYLDLWVKVKKDWRNDEKILKILGYR